jgi:dihydropteroate synthase
MRGARVVRVHDVEGTVQVCRVIEALVEAAT